MDSAHIVTVGSWSELQEELFDGSWEPTISRYRSRYVFRGLNDHQHRLTTSIMRLGGPQALLEKHILRNFRKYAPSAVVERDSVWHWLTLGQHHGLPTRLLDWTYSPFIAMHFATTNTDYFDRDGVIWAVHVSDALEFAPDEFKAEWNKIGGYGLDLDTLPQLVPTLEAFETISQTPFVVFFEPPSIDDRIINQYAIFSALSDPQVAIDDWLSSAPVTNKVKHKRLIIPAALKWEIRDKLDHANITERMLFPGLDGLCIWLRRYYSPNNSGISGGTVGGRPTRP